MQLNESLEELLNIYGARIISENSNTFYVMQGENKPFPDEVKKIALSINMSHGSYAIPILGRFEVEEFETLNPPTVEYEFDLNHKQALRALLFLDCEKERYQEFCKLFDEDIDEELSDK